MKFEQQTIAQSTGKPSTEPDLINSEWKTILEGISIFLLGFIGFLASFWFAWKVKAIVGMACLFGAGLIGLGVFRSIFGARYPIMAWVVAILSALFGLFLTLQCLFLLMGPISFE